MFNIGPLEFVVLAAIALIVFGPDKLPQLAKDAARTLRTLRDVAQGARSQLNSELGPDFADFDLASLNPRTAIKNALLGDDDFDALNPKNAFQRILRGEDEPAAPAPVDFTKPAAAASPPLAADERPPFDADAT